MEGVVTHGTGTAALIPGVRVAGKTGTAQGLPGEAPNVWFIGFAPANDPQVAVAVFLDRRSGYGAGATGGMFAAPIAERVMRAVLGR
jgi:peptidoglycan glycosyltransferase